MANNSNSKLDQVLNDYNTEPLNGITVNGDSVTYPNGNTYKVDKYQLAAIFSNLSLTKDLKVGTFTPPKNFVEKINLPNNTNDIKEQTMDELSKYISDYVEYKYKCIVFTQSDTTKSIYKNIKSMSHVMIGTNNGTASEFGLSPLSLVANAFQGLINLVGQYGDTPILFLTSISAGNNATGNTFLYTVTLQNAFGSSITFNVSPQGKISTNQTETEIQDVIEAPGQSAVTGDKINQNSLGNIYNIGAYRINYTLYNNSFNNKGIPSDKTATQEYYPVFKDGKLQSEGLYTMSQFV